MACPPPSSRQRIPDRPTKSGDRFKLRGLLPRLYSRLLIALIVTWIVLVILHTVMMPRPAPSPALSAARLNCASVQPLRDAARNVLWQCARVRLSERNRSGDASA